MSYQAVTYGAVATTEEDDYYGAGRQPRGTRTEFHKKRRCNDCLFAVLFIAHLALVVLECLHYNWQGAAEELKDVAQGKIPLNETNILETITSKTNSTSADEADVHPLTEASKYYYEYGGNKDVWKSEGVVKYVGIVFATALVLSTVSLAFISYFAAILVELALLFTILATAAVGGYGIYLQRQYMALAGAGAFAITLLYTCCVWKRIPFAAANLRTAIAAVQTNFGLVLLSYFWEVVAFAYALVWINSSGSAVYQARHVVPTLFVYLLSFFWTQQVINNVQQVIVASVIGTWWYRPEAADQCWDSGLNAAICHTLTLSFGSVCFGSFFAGVAQALQWTFELSKSNEYCSCLTSVLECLLSCLKESIEYFNRWAFTFVGIHGDSYIQSGRKVVKLFKQRGWVAIVTDGLAGAVMTFMTMTIALLTGIVGWYIVSSLDDDIFVSLGISADDDGLLGFTAAFLIGWLTASIMMELIGSAEKAVIVCFAEAPGVFQDNYPRLCEKMLEAWKEAYPDECSDDFDEIIPSKEDD